MRILLVEDEPNAARMLAKGLREESYAFDVAADGESALEQAHVNDYDLIILDGMLPRKDGFEVCRELRAAGGRLVLAFQLFASYWPTATGGLLVPHIGRIFRRRTSVLLMCELLSVLVLGVVGFVPNFWVAVTLLILWGLMFAAAIPMRQGYLHALIPSEQRTTVLSFDSLFGSTGGVVAQPLLGKADDVWGYPVSYIFSAAIQALAVPFTRLARRERAGPDAISTTNGELRKGRVKKRRERQKKTMTSLRRMS